MGILVIQANFGLIFGFPETIPDGWGVPVVLSDEITNTY